jgi:hypothetical protein
MANPEDTQDDSIAAALNAAFDKIEAGEKPEPEEKLEFEQQADSLDEKDTVSADDEKTDETTEAKKDDDEEDRHLEAQSKQEKPENEAQEEDPAPSSWKREIAAKWQELPVEVKKEINRRESDYHKGIEQYKQYAGIGRDIERVIAPHMETIQKLGVHPMEAVGALLNADRQLRTGTPEQKAQLLGQLAQEYGIDPKQVQPPPPIDPAVMQLRQQNQQLQRFQQSVIEQQNSQAMSEIERFSKDPANAHFESVKDDMALLLQSGKADSLQDAYDKAVWMRPDIRKSLVEQQRTEAEQKARAARAKSANVGIKGSSAKTGSTLKSDASLRDTLRAAFNGDL